MKNLSGIGLQFGLVPRQGDHSHIAEAEEEKCHGQQTGGFLEVQKAVSGEGCERREGQIENMGDRGWKNESQEECGKREEDA